MIVGEAAETNIARLIVLNDEPAYSGGSVTRYDGTILTVAGLNPGRDMDLCVCAFFLSPMDLLLITIIPSE
jgi:hypothetical protein